MKKLSFLGLIFVLCPFIFGIATAAPTQIQPNTQLGAATSDDQNLNIGSDMLGIHGPFAFSTIYSKTYGLILQGKYTQLLNPTNAFALELDGGKAERRAGVTWGHVLTPNQRFKVTAENLSQKMNFDFDSGQVSKWVSQNAIGGTYEYLLSNKFVKDLNLNAYYSKANSKDLGYKDFIQSNHRWRNYRRIAGATDKSGSMGIDVSPAKSTLVGLKLNYDKIKYNTRYENSNNDSSGLGATVSLHQLVNQHVQFSLLASDRKPYKDYQAEVDWLLHSAPGTQLQLGLIGERIDGNLGLPNDNRVGLNLSYSWGGNSNQSATFSDPAPNNDASGLKDWTNTPAIHMSQVLAIKDQKTVDMGVVSKPAGKTNDDGFYWNKSIHPDSAIIEKNGQSFDFIYGDDYKKDDALIFNGALYNKKMTVTCDDLSSYSNLKCILTSWGEIGYDYTVEVKGSFSQADFAKAPNHIITFKVHGRRADGKLADVTFSFEQWAPINLTMQTIHDRDFTVGSPAEVALAKIKANQGTIDVSSIKLDHDLAKEHSLALDTDRMKTDCTGKQECIIYLNSDSVTNATVGEPEKNITLTASNKNDNSSASGTFALTIAGSPIITDPNLGSGSYIPGGTIESIDLSSHFNNPLQSGVIQYTLKDKQGYDIEKIEEEYGLEVKGNTLVADHPIAQDAQNDEIYVYAHNDIGKTTKCAEYIIKITDGKPIITMNPQVEKCLIAGKPVPTGTLLADVTANAGNVDPTTIKVSPDLSTAHHIYLDTHECTGKSTCKIYLCDDPKKPGDVVTSPTFDQEKQFFNFTAGNTAGKSSSASFKLDVESGPVVDGADLGSGSVAALGTGKWNVHVPTHFKNPLGCDPMYYAYEVKDAAGKLITGDCDVMVNTSGDLVVQACYDMPIGVAYVHVFARNNIDRSKDYLTFKLTVYIPRVYVEHPHNLTYTNGESPIYDRHVAYLQADPNDGGKILAGTVKIIGLPWGMHVRGRKHIPCGRYDLAVYGAPFVKKCGDFPCNISYTVQKNGLNFKMTTGVVFTVTVKPNTNH